jgi:hypothetical protein
MAARANLDCLCGDEYQSISDFWVGIRGAVIAC